jgi:alpha-beta hydrolase superfamily lysophospholipase
MSRKDFTIPSKDGVHKLHVVLWEPDCGDVKGVVQISHGMTEMIERYDNFARFLNKNGYVVIGNDHLGHGLTAGNNADLGYFCPDDMSATIVSDLRSVTKYAKKEFKQKPYFMLGHSMGSFLERRYIMTYPMELDGAIISGTGNQSYMKVFAGKAVSQIVKCFFGDRYRSKFIKNSVFKDNLSRIDNPRTENDWLTKDEKIVDWYNANKYCTFNFTVNGYRGLFEVISYIQKKKNISKISKDLSIFIVSGDADPIGDYGKSVKEVYRQYKKSGIKDISLKLYPNDRHEILNETDRLEVYADILRWIDERAGKNRK